MSFLDRLPSRVILGVVVAVSAVISGLAWSVHEPRLGLMSGIVAVASVVLPLVFLAVLIGLGVRSSEGFQHLRLPFGILLALIITSALFAFGHYGQDNCYP